MAAPVSIYLHIPFCIRKCAYCDFLSAPAEEETRARYVHALVREILSAGNREELRGREVDTIFFGGGTPTLLCALQLDEILDAVHQVFHVLPQAEVTMECNPGTADFESLLQARRLGINRLSVGVQSFDDKELRLLGRIHTAQEAREVAYAARRAGYENLSMDLMSALPGQRRETLLHSLHEAMQLEPEHLSVYSLILEEGTAFYEQYVRGSLPKIPDDEADRTMYYDTREILRQYGLMQYEISNYALPGRECRHNIGYWTGHEYLGCGIGAASLIGELRFSVTRDLTEYLEHSGDPEFVRRDVTRLGISEQMEEFMFLGLRMTRGVREEDFAERFGKTLDEVYEAVIRRHVRNGLLRQEDGRLMLTERGMDLANTVMADFLLQAVSSHEMT